jgi:oligopeptide transport system substrate-binding protein
MSRAVVSALALAALAAAWLAGCEEPASVSETPAREFVRGNGPEPESLDPHLAQAEPAMNILRDLYEGLTALDAAGQVIPGAASAWESSGDGLEWVFTLRAEARWSDARQVTAEDFAWSLGRLTDPATGSPNALLLGRVEEVRAEAQDRLVIRLAEPAPWLPEVLAHPAASPLRRDVVEAHGREHARPGRLVGNGPYRLVEWTLGSHVLLERNPLYWRDQETGVDRVRYIHLADRAAELSRYRAGELDLSYSVPVARFFWLTENMADQLRVSPHLAVYFYGFNTRQPPLDDARVRRALALAADRELLTARVIGTGEAPACGLVPPGIDGYAGQRMPGCGAQRARRMQEARALLAEAGYGPHKPLELEIRYNTGEVHERIAVAIGALWKQELGVETKLVREEFRVLLGHIRAGFDTQVYRASWIADFRDPSTFLGILAGDSPFNGTGWSDPEYDGLLERAARAPDPAQRMRLLEKAEARMLDQAPVMPLYFYASKYLVRAGVAGIRDNPLNVHPSRFVRLCGPAEGC